MNVLIHSDFGMPSSVRSSGKLTDPAGVVAYHQHLEVLLNYSYHFLAIPHWLLNFLISPRKWRLVGRAAIQFRSSILQMLDEERKEHRRRRNERELDEQASEKLRGRQNGHKS